LLEGKRRMAKKMRRSARNAATATKNFAKWLPKGVESFFRQIPPTAKRTRPWIVSFRGALTLLCLILVFVLPLITSNEFVLGIFVTANILVIFAASWDLLAGFAGQSSFGHAAFLGIGGYIGGAMVKYYGQPWWVSLFVAAVVAVIFALIIGIPCLRLRGPYFSLGTLAFALILYALFQSGTLKPWLGGSEGVSEVPPLSSDPRIAYVIILVMMILSILAMLAISNSRVGTVFKAIRDDPTSAEASGINTTKYKLVALMVSAFFAGIAGSLYAFQFRGVSPEIFNTEYSFYAIVMASLGGIATVFGSIGGAYFFWFLTEFLSGIVGFSLLLFAIVLMIVLRFLPGGAVRPTMERLREFWDILRGK
jgi:branched-chain amino acid transport system permease protein